MEKISPVFETVGTFFTEHTCATTGYYVVGSLILSFVGYKIWKLFTQTATFEDCSFRGCEDADLTRVAIATRKKWAINEVRKRKKQGQYFPPYPNGWFAVIESDSLKKGEAKEAYVFGQELVVWRGMNGTAYVADAYCPHLGAHLGVEGTVTGDCIQCPFHNWTFDGKKDGKLVCIPYAKDPTKVLDNVHLKMWKTKELNGFVFVWHHSEIPEPNWSPYEVPETVHGRCHFRIDTTVACHIQDIFENGADIAHFVPIHGRFFANGQSLTEEPLPASLAKHAGWESAWKVEPESGGIETSVTIQSWLELFGFNVSKVSILGKEYGPGIFVNWYDTPFGKVAAVLIATPIEPLLVRVVQRFYSTNILAQIWSMVLQRAHAIQFARDVSIWNRKIDRAAPPLAKEDQQIKTFRRYYSQFYPKKVD